MLDLSAAQQVIPLLHHNKPRQPRRRRVATADDRPRLLQRPHLPAQPLRVTSTTSVTCPLPELCADNCSAGRPKSPRRLSH